MSTEVPRIAAATAVTGGEQTIWTTQGRGSFDGSSLRIGHDRCRKAAAAPEGTRRCKALPGETGHLDERDRVVRGVRDLSPDGARLHRAVSGEAQRERPSSVGEGSRTGTEAPDDYGGVARLRHSLARMGPEAPARIQFLKTR